MAVRVMPQEPLGERATGPGPLPNATTRPPARKRAGSFAAATGQGGGASAEGPRRFGAARG